MAQQKRKKTSPRGTGKAAKESAFRDEINSIFEDKPEIDEEYIDNVGSAYSGYRKGQLNQAVENTHKKLKVSIDPAMSAIASLIFSEKHLDRAVDAATKILETSSIKDMGTLAERLSTVSDKYSITPDLKSAVAEYGKAHNLSAEDAVKSPEARLYGINRAYGSLADYQKLVMEDIVSGSKRFAYLNTLSQAPALNFVLKMSAYAKVPGVSRAPLGKLINIAQKFGLTTRESLTHTGMFGEELVKQYADIKVKEMKQYEKLDK